MSKPFNPRLVVGLGVIAFALVAGNWLYGEIIRECETIVPEGRAVSLSFSDGEKVDLVNPPGPIAMIVINKMSEVLPWGKDRQLRGLTFKPNPDGTVSVQRQACGPLKEILK